MRTTRMLRAALAALLLFAVGATANAATFTINRMAGFDDQTPVSPTPGNPATTLGEARFNVLKQAGLIWGSLLVSAVPISVDASFAPLECNATSATLAQTKPTQVFAVNGPIPNVLYVSALANAIRGEDLTPNAADIEITINSKLDSDPTCFAAGRFYLGLDHNPPFGQQDLLTTVLHEFAHGLGFVSLVNLDPNMVDNQGTKVPVGASLVGDKFGSYDQFVLDESTGKVFTDSTVTPMQRYASASRTGQLVWNGTNVNGNLAFLTSGRSANNRLRLFAPVMVSSGSSIAHFDEVATPNILMEPNLMPDLPGNTDVTVCALRDIGWQVTRCPDFTTVTASMPPVVTTPPPTTTPTMMSMAPSSGGGKKGGGGGALYLPLLIALAGLVPLRSRLRRRETLT